MRDYEIIGKGVTDYIPIYYRDSPLVRNLLDREVVELSHLNENISSLIDQLFVETATWGLSYWENVLRIPSDSSKPFDQRRSVIKSRLRGTGTVTVELIENVAESYSNGTVSVIEDIPNYTIVIKFISTLGIPTNLGDIYNALREIVPAHLAVHFEFSYLTWGELDDDLFTWDAMDALGLSWDELEVYRS